MRSITYIFKDEWKGCFEGLSRLLVGGEPEQVASFLQDFLFFQHVDVQQALSQVPGDFVVQVAAVVEEGEGERVRVVRLEDVID